MGTHSGFCKCQSSTFNTFEKGLLKLVGGDLLKEGGGAYRDNPQVLNAMHQNSLLFFFCVNKFKIVLFFKLYKELQV